MFTSKIVHLNCRKVCIILLGRNWCTSWIPNHRHAWYFFGMRHGSGCIEYWCLKRLRPKPLCRGNLQHLKTIAGGGAIWNSLCWSKGWETLPISLQGGSALLGQYQLHTVPIYGQWHHFVLKTVSLQLQLPPRPYRHQTLQYLATFPHLKKLELKIWLTGRYNKWPLHTLIVWSTEPVTT